MRLRSARPRELTLVQSPRAQPEPEAVVHEHLEAIAAPVRKQVGVMRLGLSEDLLLQSR